MTIKKLDHWQLNKPPDLFHFWRRYGSTSAPVQPNKIITYNEWKHYLTLNDGDKIDNALLNGTHSFLLEDLEIKIDHSKGSEDYDCDIMISLGKYVKQTKENLYYDKEMLEYEHDMVDYQRALSLHDIDVKEWTAWKVQENKRMLEQKINDAKCFLENNGFRVTNE